jgi:hypothetical protein
MTERRVVGTYRTTPADFIDHFLQKIDEERDKKDTLYTGKGLLTFQMYIYKHAYSVEPYISLLIHFF